nr:MAG TPA: hypothetical protein [Caudoviricetes sp.]
MSESCAIDHSHGQLKKGEIIALFLLIDSNIDTNKLDYELFDRKVHHKNSFLIHMVSTIKLW